MMINSDDLVPITIIVSLIWSSISGCRIWGLFYFYIYN